jgi:pimeloyl-ACP methyl ester carboxylesterase
MALLLTAAAPPAEIAPTLVPVEGSRMAFYPTGSGRVTVVLEAGFGGDHTSWRAVQPLLAGKARVVSYDRLGHGASGPSARPRSAGIAAEQLREGLARAGIAPPYLLVGHSFGGAIARIFADRWPADVHGLVLVDPSHEDFNIRAALEATSVFGATLESQLAEDDRDTPQMQREVLGWETSMVQLRQTKSPPKDRTILLSAGRMMTDTPALQLLWLDVAKTWAKRVGVRHQIVDAPHNIQRTNPEVVVQAVEKLLPD